MLSQDGIAGFTSKVVPFLHVTSKIPGKKYDDLLLKKRFAGFPTLAFLNAQGKTLTTLHFTKRSLAGFEEGLRQAERLNALELQAATDPEAAKELLLLQMRMRSLRFVEARARAKDMDFTAKQRLAYETSLVETLSRLGLEKARKALAELSLQPAPQARARQVLLDLEIRQKLRPLMRGYRPGVDPEPPYHLAYDLYKKGKLPSDKPFVNTTFWGAVSRAACKKKDVKVFEAALPKLRKALGKSGSRWLERLEAELKTLKSQAGKSQAGQRRAAKPRSAKN